ncbi:TetR/AcrR family transcriptional regulator [Saccharomonospora azurea]|uniref:Transcriptional regulator n=1 Tax=Saccharomonospora azurea NA-128 TaxID=882081 RepID=H8G736_9PSEU|nr:TetR/AcrR family transcriptional regulator [Saccharomonospora azurea]EHY87305.1 transcriptional regulator [Saccharomonospora azurea NA-128]
MSDANTEPARRGRPRRGPDPERFREIVEAAAEVFLGKGYSGTSIQDISHRVGILKGSLYHYVRSKEDFLYRIIKDVYDEAIAEIRKVSELEGEPLEKLAEFIRLHVRFTASHLTAYTIQLREFEQLSAERPEEIRRGGETYVEALQVVLEGGAGARGRRRLAKITSAPASPPRGLWSSRPCGRDLRRLGVDRVIDVPGRVSSPIQS